MKQTIHIAIVDDHDIVREGLISLLRGHEFIKVVFEAGNGLELLEKLKTKKIDIVLLDLDMPVMSGKDAFEKIKQKYPQIKTIIMSATFREPIIIDYIKKGVSAFLHKNCRLDKLIEAISAVHTQGIHFDEQVAKMLAKEINAPVERREEEVAFTKIETNILKLICQGLTSKQIGEKLFLNHRTVEWHRSQMMRKTNSSSSSALIAHAVLNNLV